MKLYAIYDEVKNQFSPPMMCITDGQAWREFDQFVAQDKYAVTHQHEFELYWIGDYDEHYGIIDPNKDGALKLVKNLDTEDLINTEVPF